MQDAETWRREWESGRTLLLNRYPLFLLLLFQIPASLNLSESRIFHTFRRIKVFLSWMRRGALSLRYSGSLPLHKSDP